jgi:protein-S-isoprenylcysteine O-methyltransferase Ste14
MTLIPAFEVGLANGWLFMIVYPLQWLAVLVLPRRIVDRTRHPPEIVRTRADRIIAFLTQGLWIGATVLSVFLPLRIGTPWFWVGLASFLVGLAVLVLASVAVARTPDNVPFTTGIYRFSRHPMYLSMVLVYLGVSIAAASWLFLLVTVATFFLQRRQMLTEEAHCIERYGRGYRDYLAVTARWFGMPSRSRDAS